MEGSTVRFQEAFQGCWNSGYGIFIEDTMKILYTLLFSGVSVVCNAGIYSIDMGTEYNTPISGGSEIKSFYTTEWECRAPETFYKTSFAGDRGSYTGVRLGYSYGFLTAYPHATFATIGFYEHPIEDTIIMDQYGSNLTSMPFISGGGGGIGIPPFLPPYEPPVDPPHTDCLDDQCGYPVPEPSNLNANLLILACIILVIYKIKRLMCKNM